jgi:hypothetical protein
MFLGDFHPFPATCATLSTQQNELCSAVLSFIINDGKIYSSQLSFINDNLLKKIKFSSYQNIPACKAFENLLTRQKKYIVEELNKGPLFTQKFGYLTTKKLDKDIRREISCQLVNNFLQDHEHEIKKLIGDDNESDSSDSDDSDGLSEDKEINIEEEKEIFISSSKNGTSKYCDDCGLDMFDECRCNDAEEPEEIKHLREVEELKNKIDELECFESKYRKELYNHNATEEALKGATEIINNYNQNEKKLIDEIKELKQERKDDKIYINDYEENFNRLVNKYNKLERETNEKNKEIEKLKESRTKILELLKKIVDNKELII